MKMDWALIGRIDIAPLGFQSGAIANIQPQKGYPRTHCSPTPPHCGAQQRTGEAAEQPPQATHLWLVDPASTSPGQPPLCQPADSKAPCSMR